MSRRISLSAYKKNKEALAVAPPSKERRLGFGESVSTREVRPTACCRFPTLAVRAKLEICDKLREMLKETYWYRLPGRTLITWFEFRFRDNVYFLGPFRYKFGTAVLLIVESGVGWHVFLINILVLNSINSCLAPPATYVLLFYTRVRGSLGPGYTRVPTVRANRVHIREVVYCLCGMTSILTIKVFSAAACLSSSSLYCKLPRVFIVGLIDKRVTP